MLVYVLYQHLYVLYQHPADAAYRYTLHRWHAQGSRIAVDPEVWLWAQTESGLAVMRKELELAGLTRLERFKDDDPAIVETWI